MKRSSFRTQMQRMLLAAILVAGSIFAIVILYRFNPSTTHFYPRCPTRSLLGIECPGCGSLRASHALLHGRLLTAWHYNPLLLLSLPMVLLLSLSSALRKRSAAMNRLYLALNSRTSILIVAFVLFGWGVLRNFL